MIISQSHLIPCIFLDYFNDDGMITNMLSVPGIVLSAETAVQKCALFWDPTGKLDVWAVVLIYHPWWTQSTATEEPAVTFPSLRLSSWWQTASIHWIRLFIQLSGTTRSKEQTLTEQRHSCTSCGFPTATLESLKDVDF